MIGLVNKAGASITPELVDGEAVAYKANTTTATAVGTITVGVVQIETATIVGTIDVAGAGDIDVTVTAAGMNNSPKTIQVAVANNDTAAQVAAKVIAELDADADVSAFFSVGGTGDDVVLTALTAAANDATMNIAYDNGTATGLTPDATSTNTQAGVAPGTGNAEVIITSSLVTGSPVTILVPVVAGDTAATWAGKVRAAIADNAAVMEHYNVGGASTAITLTPRTPAAEDATLNIALDNDTSTGITPDATSTTTGSFVARGVEYNPVRGGKLYVNSSGAETIKCRLAGQPKGTITTLVITAPCFVPTDDLQARIAEVYESGTTPAASEMLMMY